MATRFPNCFLLKNSFSLNYIFFSGTIEMEGRREKLKQEQNILNDLKDFLPSISCSPQKKLFYWMCMRFSGFVQTLGNYYFF